MIVSAIARTSARCAGLSAFSNGMPLATRDHAERFLSGNAASAAADASVRRSSRRFMNDGAGKEDA
jgi:hypothetical protein